MSTHASHPISHDAGAMPSDRPSLPTMLTRFVGRQHEVAELLPRLASTRCLSLVGAGGCGKTRLAHAVALADADHWRDGVGWVELAAISDPAFVIPAVARRLNVTAQPEVPLLDLLSAKLANRQLLLVFDNCEHLLPACAALVESLLLSTGVTVLATSREALGVTGELLYPVPPLTLPTSNQPFAAVAACDAIQLFVERTHNLRPEFVLTPENAESVAALCRQLDGMPLAIEMASARLNVLSVQQIQARLEHRLDLLVAPARTDPRHRTLRAAIDWSYELLTPAEQILLQRLALFAAGFTLTTVEATCAWGELERMQLLELLASLVNKSLVVVETIQGREARYRLLETIRQYASEKLAASGQWAATQDHYLTGFLEFAEEIAPKLLEQYQQLWLHWLEIEHDNLRVALAWAQESHRAEIGLRLACALYHFWDTRGYIQEGCTWFARFLRLADDLSAALPFALRVNALTFASFLAMFLQDAPTALAWSQRAVALCEAAGEAGKPLYAFALAGVISATRLAGDGQTACTLLGQSIEVERALGNHQSRTVGMSLFILGMTETTLGQYAAAHSHLAEALSLAQQAQDHYRTALIYGALGDLARCEKRFARATPLYEQGLALFHEAGAQRDLPNLQRNLAYAWLRQGDKVRAQTLFRQSLAEQQRRGQQTGIYRGLLGMAALAAASGRPLESAVLHSFVFHQRKSVTVGLDSGDNTDALDYEHYATLVRSGLNAEEWATAQVKGRAFSLDQAVAFALALPLSAVTPGTSATVSPMSELTERERAVVALIGRGLANSEIAAQLVLSKRTVEKHIANIFSKLSITNRAQLVRWALDHGLTSSAADHT